MVELGLTHPGGEEIAGFDHMVDLGVGDHRFPPSCATAATRSLRLWLWLGGLSEDGAKCVLTECIEGKVTTTLLLKY